MIESHSVWYNVNLQSGTLCKECPHIASGFKGFCEH